MAEHSRGRLLWLGGWRPTMAFHLLYSKSGIQMETRLAELTRGLGIGKADLGGLSPSQLSKADELQRRTVREERAVSERMAEVQESVADAEMVELTHLVSEEEEEEERVESAMKGKREGLAEVVEWADDLRLRTFKSVIELLTPIQAVHFLIAAAELHLKMHEWGRSETRITTVIAKINGWDRMLLLLLVAVVGPMECVEFDRTVERCG
ncbi:hypothetical protein Syun_003186 [Stephania yunnanensis]|uniref:DOG1 domain-containing protein n=1 Tax=Stephania yunnanensis TaxID=152371 RepID=A0AAP0L4K6_9MAGN